ncbi:hypothetical protein SDC9_94015 [bioreactor metagenome]|uniref:Uncharacterized protein n=1 Tax=bioreactor metagenome TaxID=1076179 RepID=A0A645A308_9ZZZZ
MFRAISTCSNERQVNVGSQNTGQFYFCFFCSFTQTLQSHTVNRKVYTGFFLKFANHPVHNTFIKVIAAKMSITICCFNFENAVAHLKDRNVESTAAKVINQNSVIVGFINTISQCRSSRFVDNTQNFQACYFASVFSCLTLAVAEVSRYSNNCLGYFFAQIFFSIFFQLLQNHRGNFFRRIFFIINCYFVISSHVTFNGTDSTVRIRNCLPFCQLSNQTLTGFRKANNRRG